MKFHICRTLILAVVIMGAGCGNLTEPNSFSFATLTGVPLNTTVQSNVVTIEGNQFAAPIAFANTSSASYSSISINGGSFTGAANQLLSPGNTLQLQQTTASTANTARTTTITVGGFTTGFTTVTGSSIPITYTDASGNTVTISSLVPVLSAGTNVVNYTITATTSFSTSNASGVAGNNIAVAFTLQAISNTGSVIYSTTVNNVLIPYSGTETQSGTLLTNTPGSLPNIVSNGLPYTINGNTITTTAYWSSLIAYWQIAPGSLTFP